MNFELTDEMVALEDSLGRLLSDLHTPQQRQAVAASAAGYSDEIWRQLSKLGVTGLGVPEQYGGFSGDASHLLPVMQAFGRELVSVPFLSSCVLCATALRAAADESIAREFLPSVATGEIQVAWAHEEPTGRDHTSPASVTAKKQSGGWYLNGTKSRVLYAASADRFVVSASMGEPPAEHGSALFLVAKQAPGAHLRSYRLIDGTPAGDLRLQDVAATPLCDPGGAKAHAGIDAVIGVGIAAVCAEMVGAMDAAFKLSVEYLNTRQQFGRLIGTNQALRHRVAEMLVSLETAKSMAIAAVLAASGAGMRDASSRVELHRAKFLIGRNARSLCQLAIQLHGGIGMTEEYAVGHYLRRVHVLDQMFGDSSAHGECLSALS
jgi:pimeloyl-CoA dehydrogenase